MQPPTFEYVPILGGSGNAKLKILMLAGLDTRHAGSNNDRGRLYATITGPSLFTVNLYSDALCGSPSLVASGNGGTLGTAMTLGTQNGSGISGRAIVEQYTLDEAGLVVVPTFAVDEDVLLDPAQCAQLPGFNAKYGLAYHHAQAMRRILTSSLPAAVPYLYGGGGAAAFVPRLGPGDLPDLTKLANVDQLRVAQADLVKMLAAKQQEHLEEFAALAKVAAENFRVAMEELAMANRHEPEAAAVEQANKLGSMTSTWNRG